MILSVTPNQLSMKRKDALPDELNATGAIAIQQQLREKVICHDQLGSVDYVAGIDVGFKNHFSLTQAAIAVLRFPQLDLVETAIATTPTTFPYIPGLLSFREIPAILKAFDILQTSPDLILCDGQGIAHPRRFGIASHLGVLLDLPSIGVAKSRLIGHHGEIPVNPGEYTLLKDQTEIVGVVLRSRIRVKPLYLSIGHRLSLSTMINYVQRCLTKYRLPEPTRIADKLASGKF